MNARAERRAMIALLTVFALFVQALTPSMALARSADGRTVICTDRGFAVAPVAGQAPAKRMPAPHCDHCVCPPAAVEAAEPQIPMLVGRRSFPADRPPPEARLRPPCRAPPRPPGQGPPAFHA